MLREQFIAAVGTPSKPPGAGAAKDAAIFIHDFQPLAAQHTTYKKSATPPRCLALSDDHVFAAQAGKAVVHVYSREKGNQEATVPFVERISAISLACADSVLVLGTLEGRILLWETGTGRLVTTSQTHLQAITALAVDATSNFLLSASQDSTVQVWSIPELLSFANVNSQAPRSLRTFDAHQSEVTAVELGHSASAANFAVSVARDKTCLVWDYARNYVLRTFLLSGIPTCVALDPADRAAYVGYENGNLQMLDLLVSPTGNVDAIQNGRDSTVPIQQAAATQWKSPDTSHGSVISLSVSFDGTVVLSGHESGSVLNWDVARRSFASAQTTSPLPGPVTNLFFLPVIGLRKPTSTASHIRVPEVVKPRVGAFDTSDGSLIPANYTFNVRFTDQINVRAQDHRASAFERALTASVFPADLIDEGLHELAAWGTHEHKSTSAHGEEASADFMLLDDASQTPAQPSLQDENAHLRQQLEALRRVQSTSFDKIEKLTQEKKVLLAKSQRRIANGSATQHGGGMLQSQSSDSSDVEVE